jgi:hypothetical protein
MMLAGSYVWPILLRAASARWNHAHMTTFADKRAAIGAAWMALATVVMLGAGIVALATGIPLDVAGLFLVIGASCALVTVSLFLVARRGRGDELASADAVPADSTPADSTPADQDEAEEGEEATADDDLSPATADATASAD